MALSDSLIHSTDKKGKAVAILHYYGDLLAHTVTPNSGFGSSVIYPIIAGAADSLTGIVGKEPAETTAIQSSSSGGDLPSASTSVVESSDDVESSTPTNIENVRT